MSYRELRNFTEILRILGYPRLVSLENFRRPNFRLIAEILHWLTLRYDNSVDVPVEIDTEQDRVIFVTSIARLIATKAYIKLNTKKVYLSDGHAVQELLKLASILYEAAKNKGEDESPGEITESSSFIETALANKFTEIKKSRQLASEITEKGARLYDILAKEIELREHRFLVLSKQLKLPELESSLKDAIKAVEKGIEEVNFKIENVASDEANLDSKIEKKRNELERYQKRLSTLKSVRPAFMDEFEKLEEEMDYIYDLYVVKFRCLVFLEHQLEDVEKAELSKIQLREAQIRKMVEQMKQEELLRGTGIEGEDTTNETDENDDKEGDESGDQILGLNNERIHRGMINTTTANKRSATGRVRMFGSILSGDREGSLDSDLDLDGDEDASDLDSDDEMELLNMTNSGGNERKSSTTSSEKKNKDNDSDNDF